MARPVGVATVQDRFHTESRPIRIVILERMDLLRAALVSLLSDEDDIEVVADVKHLDTVMPVARRLRPDVAVLADLPHPQCLSTVRGLRDEVPECGIVALIVTKPPDLVSHLIELEVGGLIDKDAPPVRLLQAIRKVADGESMIDTNLVVAALSATRNPLTPRERQTLQLAADGASGPEIAKSLALSPGTVRNYLSKAMCKTGGRTRIQAIQIATDAGWL